MESPPLIYLTSKAEVKRMRMEVLRIIARTVKKEKKKKKERKQNR